VNKQSENQESYAMKSSTASTFDDRALGYTQDNQWDIQHTGGRTELHRILLGEL
jgi:hypothetical protein